MGDKGLEEVFSRLSQNLSRDSLVQKTTDNLIRILKCDRVVLYYFYSKWEGQVTFESLSDKVYSIFGSQGPDECFNQEYAGLYEANRVGLVNNLEDAAIADCHRDFLRNLKVKANLVVPILVAKGLWGLLIAHHCQKNHVWLESEIKLMQQSAEQIASSDSISSS